MKTRQELESAHVARGVAKWGEAERAGLVKQAAKMTTQRLQHDQDEADGLSESEIVAHADATCSKKQFQAAHCNAEGLT